MRNCMWSNLPPLVVLHACFNAFVDGEFVTNLIQSVQQTHKASRYDCACVWGFCSIICFTQQLGGSCAAMAAKIKNWVLVITVPDLCKESAEFIQVVRGWQLFNLFAKLTFRKLRYFCGVLFILLSVEWRHLDCIFEACYSSAPHFCLVRMGLETWWSYHGLHLSTTSDNTLYTCGSKAPSLMLQSNSLFTAGHVKVKAIWLHY